MVNKDKRKFLGFLIVALGVVLAYVLLGNHNADKSKEIKGILTKKDPVRVEGDTLVVG